MIWMDFTMRALRKFNTKKFFSLTAILVCFLSVSLYADNSSRVIIKSANGNFNDDQYLINANIHYEIGKEIQEALDHGISIQIDIQLHARQKRDWIWDSTVESKTLSFLLEHHPLSGHYQVTNLDNYHRKHFQNLQSAIKHIGSIRNHVLFNRSELIPERNYLARIRSRLNIQNLPAPLRLQAYFSPEWNLACSWYEWMIQQ